MFIKKKQKSCTNLSLDIDNDFLSPDLDSRIEQNTNELTESLSNNKNLKTSEVINKLEINNAFYDLCDTLIEKINRNAKENKDEIRNLKKVFKKEIKNAFKHKYNSNGLNVEKKKTGFTTNEIVPPSLCELVNIDYGTKMPRTELTRKIYDVIKERKLYFNQDKRVLRADDQIKKIFKLSENVNESKSYNDKDGFNFYNIQKYIANCYNDNK